MKFIQCNKDRFLRGLNWQFLYISRILWGLIQSHQPYVSTEYFKSDQSELRYAVIVKWILDIWRLSTQVAKYIIHNFTLIACWNDILDIYTVKSNILKFILLFLLNIATRIFENTNISIAQHYMNILPFPHLDQNHLDRKGSLSYLSCGPRI